MQLRISIAVVASFVLCLLAQEYKLGPDSAPQPGVPRGTVTKYSWKSKIYPGTVRDYWIYVPAQYSPNKPAALIVFQDGAGMVAEDGAWRVPTVFDNLIQRGDIPVTIGVFIDPGVFPALTPGGQPRSNRSPEYDAVDDLYSRFLAEEILPEVEKLYSISPNPDDHAIAGSSSGGICAFAAAWYRPGLFHRVLSFIGSYTNLRGGQIFPYWIRLSEPKPIRVFLQDGQNDLNTFSGSWFLGAQNMLSALEYAGYDVTHVWGTEAHNSKHGASILPDALRWLWRGYPQPVLKSKGGGGERQWSVLLTDPAMGWQRLKLPASGIASLAGGPHGEVFFTATPSNGIWKIAPDGNAAIFKKERAAVTLTSGPDGRLYAYDAGRHNIVAYDDDGQETIVAEGMSARDIAIGSGGVAYWTDPDRNALWMTGSQGQKTLVTDRMQLPGGVRLTPDRAFLAVDESGGRWISLFQLRPGGVPENRSPFYRLEVPDESSASGAGSMVMDTEGWLYVSTTLGIQVFDARGRITAILDAPEGLSVSSLLFGGPRHDTLYAAASGSIFTRPMKRQGAVAWELVTEHFQ
jgi:sugar lactone lactonase YvrE